MQPKNGDLDELERTALDNDTLEPNAEPPHFAQLSPGRSRIVRRLVVDHLDFEGLADLQRGEILGIGPQCDHPGVCSEQEAAVLRIDRQDSPFDPARSRSVRLTPPRHPAENASASPRRAPCAKRASLRKYTGKAVPRKSIALSMRVAPSRHARDNGQGR